MIKPGDLVQLQYKPGALFHLKYDGRWGEVLNVFSSGKILVEVGSNLFKVDPKTQIKAHKQTGKNLASLTEILAGLHFDMDGEA